MSKVWTKKKRGRPKNAGLAMLRGLYPDYTSRQSIHNRIHSTRITVTASNLGLIDGNMRDVATGKRIKTKLSIVGRVMGNPFFATDVGVLWLQDNWSGIVNMTTNEIIQWERDNRPVT